MPEWLVQILAQFPVVVVIGLVGWYCYRKVERSADRFLAREEGIRAKADAEVRDANRALLAAKDEEIKRLDAALRNEVRALTRAVNELVKRLGG